MITVQSLIDYDRAHPEGAGTSPQEKMFLYQLIRRTDPAGVVEVGVSAGHMTAWIALALAHNRNVRALDSVDNWSGTYGGVAYGRGPALRRLSDLELQDRVLFSGRGSADYWDKTPADAADLVWIDGDHSYAGCLHDLREGWRVTRHLLLAHDWRHPLPDEVARACRDFEREIGRRGAWYETERGIWILSKNDMTWA